MKTLFKLTATVFSLFVVSAVYGQTDKSAAPKPVPMAAPAVKMQSQENPKKAETKPVAGTAAPATAPAPAPSKDAAKDVETPAVDNKIAVSDPGVPGEKSSTRTKKSAPPKPTPAEKKQPSTKSSPK